MIESLTASTADVHLTMAELGYGEDVQLVHTYRLYHRDRQVFRVIHPDGQDQVVKVRKKDNDGLREANQVAKLVASDRYLGGHFPTVSSVNIGDRIAIQMPFLGFSLHELAEIMDLQTMGYPPGENSFPFSGFTPEEIEASIRRLRNGHLRFAASSGIIHGDITFHTKTPNNIVYHPSIGRLFLVDGEALTPHTDEAETRFTDGVECVREWMYSNLEKI